MAFTILTLDDSHEMALALFSALLDDPNTSQGAFLWLWAKTMAGAVTDNHAHIASVFNDLLPDTASIDTTPQNPTSALARWGAITGLTQKGATGSSSATPCARVFGAPSTPVPDTTQMTDPGQLVYQIVGAYTVAAAGYVDCNIAAIGTGSATNLSDGTQLQFTNTPSGLEDTVVLQAALTNGADQEDPGAYRLRILSQLAVPAQPAYGAGKQNDYVQLALAQTGIAAAFCYPNRQGLGSVDVSALALGSGDARLLLSGQISALQATMAALVPVGVTFRVLTTYAAAVDIEYTVIPDGGATTVFDWDDTTPPTVLSWTSATNTLQFSGGTRPADMVPGDRLVVDPAAGGGTGAQFVIQSLSGADSVVLESAPVPAPVATDTVYAGGPLVDPARAAIQAYVDSLGTANPDATRYGNWEGSLDPGAIDAAVRAVAGVLRGTVVTPSSLVTATDPAYPSDATIELLIAGHIIVRCQH